MATTSGVMADFARMPTSRKVLVFVVIGLMLGLLYFRFILRSLNEELATVEGQHAANVTLDRKLADDIPKYDLLKKEMADLTETISKNQKALPTEAEVPAFFETLERKVKESGVSIHKWNKKPEEPIEQFVKVPVEIEINGTFLQIKRFLWSLLPREPEPGSKAPPERERIVSIENLVLTNPVVRNREVLLNAKFLAVTFRKDDTAGAGPQTPGAPPAAPRPNPNLRPPAEVSPTAPPMPSPGTPAGAKAGAEAGVKKSDDKVRNAAEVETPSGSARLKGGL